MLYFLIDPFFKSGAEMLSCKSLLSCMETYKITKVSICTLRTQTVMKPKQPSPGMMLFKCQARLEKDFNGGNRSQPGRDPFSLRDLTGACSPVRSLLPGFPGNPFKTRPFSLWYVLSVTCFGTQQLIPEHSLTASQVWHLSPELLLQQQTLLRG